MSEEFGNHEDGSLEAHVGQCHVSDLLRSFRSVKGYCLRSWTHEFRPETDDTTLLSFVFNGFGGYIIPCGESSCGISFQHVNCVNTTDVGNKTMTVEIFDEFCKWLPHPRVDQEVFADVVDIFCAENCATNVISHAIKWWMDNMKPRRQAEVVDLALFNKERKLVKSLAKTEVEVGRFANTQAGMAEAMAYVQADMDMKASVRLLLKRSYTYLALNGADGITTGHGDQPEDCAVHQQCRNENTSPPARKVSIVTPELKENSTRPNDRPTIVAPSDNSTFVREGDSARHVSWAVAVKDLPVAALAPGSGSGGGEKSSSSSSSSSGTVATKSPGLSGMADSPVFHEGRFWSRRELDGGGDDDPLRAFYCRVCGKKMDKVDYLLRDQRCGKCWFTDIVTTIGTPSVHTKLPPRRLCRYVQGGGTASLPVDGSPEVIEGRKDMMHYGYYLGKKTEEPPIPPIVMVNKKDLLIKRTKRYYCRGKGCGEVMKDIELAVSKVLCFDCMEKKSRPVGYERLVKCHECHETSIGPDVPSRRSYCHDCTERMVANGTAFKSRRDSTLTDDETSDIDYFCSDQGYDDEKENVPPGSDKKPAAKVAKAQAKPAEGSLKEEDDECPGGTSTKYQAKRKSPPVLDSSYEDSVRRAARDKKRKLAQALDSSSDDSDSSDEAEQE